MRFTIKQLRAERQEHTNTEKNKLPFHQMVMTASRGSVMASMSAVHHTHPLLSRRCLVPHIFRPFRRFLFPETRRIPCKRHVSAEQKQVEGTLCLLDDMSCHLVTTSVFNNMCKMECLPSVFPYVGLMESLKFSYKAKGPTLTLSAGKEETSTSGRSEVPQAKPDLGDPAQTVVWGGRVPSRRRAITGGLTGLAIGESLRLAAPASVVNLQSIIGIFRGREVAPTCPAVCACTAYHSAHKLQE